MGGNGFLFRDGSGKRLPNGEVLQFMIFYNENEVPTRVEHYFEGECPYCQKKVLEHSLCVKNGHSSGSIGGIWKKVTLKRSLNSKI